MALGSSFFQNLGAVASDLAAGEAALSGARMRASGLRLNAQGTRLGAEGTRIGAEGTRINAQGMRIKSQGDIAEAENYDLAAALARKNEAYAARSTEIQQSQLDRKITLTIGGQKADVAGAGFKESGSAIYLLRDSAQQGALAKQVLAEQGEITEAGYEEQAKSFDTMSAAARMAAAGGMDIARRTDLIADRSDAIAGQTDAIAGQQDVLAGQTEEEGVRARDNSQITASIHGIAAIASLFI
jgi:hypothetical protein